MNFEIESKDFFKNPTIRYASYGIAALIISLIHLVFLKFISVEGLTPDILLIFCVWVALREGQFVGMFAGFACGILFDIITQDVIGTNALSKTLVAFSACWFYKRDTLDQILSTYKFLVIVLCTSLLHNLVYYFFYIKLSELSFLPFFLKYGIAISLYTTVFAVIVMLAHIPSRRIKV